MILAVDPGKDKCGLALAKEDGAIIERRICGAKEAANFIRSYKDKYPQGTVVVGGGTRSRELLSQFSPDANLISVDEKFSTLEARKLFWKENPPRGILRFIPEGLRILPRPIDDYAAAVLARRYLTLSTRAGASRG